MWSNITGAVGAALQQVQKIQNEIENQMDSAVGLEKKPSVSTEAVDAPLSLADVSTVTQVKDVIDSGIKIVDDDIQDKNLGLVTKDTELNHLQTSNDATATSPINDIDLKSDDSHNPSMSSFHRSLSKSTSFVETSVNSQFDQENRVAALYEQKIAMITQEHEDKLRFKLEEAQRESKLYFESILKQQEEVSQQEAKQQIEKEKYLWKQNVENIELTYKQMLQQLEVKYKAKIEQVLENAQFTAVQTKPELEDQDSYNLRIQYENIVTENAALSSSLECLKKENEMLKDTLQTTQQHVFNLSTSKEAESRTLQSRVATLEGIVKDLNVRLENDVGNLLQEKQQLIQAIQQQNEIIAQRERSLETSTQQYSYLQQECIEKEQTIKNLQAVNSAPSSQTKLEEELKKFQDLLKEKQTQLQEFELEGRNLAKKQSEMEQKVRKSKSEMKERDADILKLREHKESCMKTIENMQDVIRNKEAEVSNLQKTIVALQTVNQTASEKVTKLEAEIVSKNDELLNYKRSIENTWAENNEIRKHLNEKTNEINELKKQLGENTSKVFETESTRRDVEQREAILRATSKQYQENLLQQMQEKALIEERLKSEVQEMRLRWQEAVEAREHLTTEIAQVTQPLLKEIQSLQEQLRNKVNFYQENERQLMEKLCKLETLQEQFEHKKTLYEENYSEIKSQLLDSKKNIQQLEQESFLQKQEKEKLLAKVELSIKEKQEFEMVKIQEYLGRIQALQQEIQEMGSKHNSVVHLQLQQYDNMSKEKDAMITQLQRDLKQLRDLRNVDNPVNLQYDSPKKQINSGLDVQADFSSQLSLPSAGTDSNSKG